MRIDHLVLGNLFVSKSLPATWPFIGGTAPMIGAHSVMDKPEPVRRVMPPMTTIAKIRKQPPAARLRRNDEIDRSYALAITIPVRQSSNRSRRSVVLRLEEPAVGNGKAQGETQVAFLEQVGFDRTAFALPPQRTG